ncbi:signal peptidase II [Microlunatus elymi]|uniref:Lipoprotein signal peptidase n=1 Tax=Microlunatus elymi TaxID=2596828 RepID=A0A516Q2C3_9ACTN|nr:signal peptidase II [Microlunatus elymi]QDP97580.1 signal peptidase II [Microlunatus elymi]
MQTTRGTSITENAPDRGRRRARSRWLFVVVALAGLAVDVITKKLAVRFLDPSDPVVLFGGLIRLQLIRNSGAAFSMGENYTLLFTILASLVLIFILAVLLPRLGHVGWAVALGLLVAGVAGNLADRIFRPPSPLHGHVVDFIQLPHYAIFNFADMCVTSAAVLIVILAIFRNVAVSGEHYARTGKSTGHSAESAQSSAEPLAPERMDKTSTSTVSEAEQKSTEQ